MTKEREAPRSAMGAILLFCSCFLFGWLVGFFWGGGREEGREGEGEILLLVSVH